MSEQRTEQERVAHTPGPWWVDDRRGKHGLGAMQVMARHRGAGSSYCVASVNHWEFPEANAALIAAAPEMLEALREFVDAAINYDAEGGVDRMREAIRRGSELIGKARGSHT